MIHLTSYYDPDDPLLSSVWPDKTKWAFFNTTSVRHFASWVTMSIPKNNKWQNHY